MNLLDLQRSPRSFRESLLIDTAEGPVPFAKAMDPFQRADFAALDTGWQRVTNPKTQARYGRAWIERARGGSKTHDLATMATWALFASKRNLTIIGAAADRDQASLLRDAIFRLAQLNPWLGRLLEIQANRVVNPTTGSTLEIIASDAKTAMGLTPDAIIVDEIVHHQNRDLWDSLLSAAAKRSTCMLVTITNAGMAGEWQWVTREAIREDPNWYFSRQETPASWISPALLAEQRRLLPHIAYERLWLNIWAPAGGGDALDSELIDYAFRPNLAPQQSATDDFEYVAGVDLGIARDASAVCVLGVNTSHAGHGHIRLAATRVWHPTKTQRVNLQEVEDELIVLHERFGFTQLNYDPWQAVHLASRLQSSTLGAIVHGRDRKANLPMVEVPPTGKNLQAMATAVLESFNDRRFELYEEADLRRDLQRMRIEERAWGFRIVSPRDSLGHGDLGTAFSLALMAAVESAQTPTIVIGRDFQEPGQSPSEAYAAFLIEQWRLDQEDIRRGRELEQDIGYQIIQQFQRRT